MANNITNIRISPIKAARLLRKITQVRYVSLELFGTVKMHKTISFDLHQISIDLNEHCCEMFCCIQWLRLLTAVKDYFDVLMTGGGTGH